MVLFDFSEHSDLSGWQIVNDAVMGGKSKSDLRLDSGGNGVFSGAVSLENNGGFCSVRYEMDKISLEGFTAIAFRIKGDGKRYQVRVRANNSDYQAYIAYFETSGEWQTMRVPLNTLYPSFRGRRLELPNFNQNTIEELSFLINNKKAETFQLKIDKIFLE